MTGLNFSRDRGLEVLARPDLFTIRVRVSSTSTEPVRVVGMWGEKG